MLTDALNLLDKAREKLYFFILGALLAVACTYITMNKLHSKELEIVRLQGKVKIDSLNEKVVNLEKQIAGLKEENSTLKEHNSENRSISDIEVLISNIDEEIKKKKLELSMAASSSIDWVSEDGAKNPENSDQYNRIERELAELQEQRNAARKQQIELISRAK